MANILLVDDDELSRGAIHKMLERSGHGVHSTGAGQEALDLYRAGQYDMTITDLIMPDVDGLEIIQQVLRINPTARVLAISGGGRVDAEEYLSVATKFGAVAVLAKPFTGKELNQAVERTLASRNT